MIKLRKGGYLVTLLWEFLSERGDTTGIGQVKVRSGAAAGSYSLSCGGGWSELLPGGGNSLLPSEPSPELFLLLWVESLLVRAAMNWDLINTYLIKRGTYHCLLRYSGS